jgi:hypothetical protein
MKNPAPLFRAQPRPPVQQPKGAVGYVAILVRAAFILAFLGVLIVLGNEVLVPFLNHLLD